MSVKDKFATGDLLGQLCGKSQPPGIQVQRKFTSEGANPLDVEWVKRNVLIRGRDGQIVFQQDGVEAPEFWSQNAVQVTAHKYFRGTPGTPEREWSVRQIITRVVDAIWRWGSAGKYFRDDASAEVFVAELLHMLVHQMYAFNSPVWFNIGVPGVPQQSSACFINSVQDSMESILDLAVTEGRIFRGGSGAGVNLSPLRAAGEKLTGGGHASGPVSFMRGYDAFAGAIKSAGRTRRAAKMVILNADHPDIREFIATKRTAEEMAHALVTAGWPANFTDPRSPYNWLPFQNANNSVRATDRFMLMATGTDPDEWILSGITSKPARSTSAKKLLEEIAEAAWFCADPGMQFDDTIQAWNMVPNTARINATNPCCFVGDTLVDTSVGKVSMEWLAIRSARGEWLPQAFGWDVEHKVPACGRIKRAWKAGETTELARVCTTRGLIFQATPEHKFYLHGGKIVEARDLRAGDRLRLATASYPITDDLVESVEIKQGLAPTSVYDIEVESIHNFGVTMRHKDHSIVVSNSEFVFLDDTACNLGSLNLMKFLQDDGTFDADAFQHAVRIAILAQEILVGNSDYPTEKIRDNSYALRPLGLGYANLGALLMVSGLPYASEEARDYAQTITALMNSAAYHQSAIIARDHGGPFAEWKKNSEAGIAVLLRHQEAALNARGSQAELCIRAAQTYGDAITLAVETGLRNAQVTVLAPTGTTGFMMDCDTTGVEPDVGLVKVKTLVGGGTMKLMNQSVVPALKRLGYTSAEQEAILKHLESTGTLQGSMLKPEHLLVFASANEIPWEDHIKMVAAVQPHLSGAVSKTISMPENSTVEDVRRAYILSWQLGLKAISIYRDGCKRSQPLSSVHAPHGREAPVLSTEEGTSRFTTSVGPRLLLHLQKCQTCGKSIKKMDTVICTPTESHHLGCFKQVKPYRRKLPETRKGVTHKFRVGDHTGYMHVGEYPDGSFGEVFVDINKEGTVVSGLLGAVGTAVSIAVQHGVPLAKFVEKFSFTNFPPQGFTANPDVPNATSLLDYVFRWLDIHYVEEKAEPVIGEGVPSPAAAPQLRKSVTISPAVAEAEHLAVKYTMDAHSDTPPCATCGVLMTRSGTCYKCGNCGETSGCS